MYKRSILTACLATALAASTATAQLGGVTQPLGGLPNPLGDVGQIDRLGGIGQIDPVSQVFGNVGRAAESVYETTGSLAGGIPGVGNSGGISDVLGIGRIGEIAGVSDLPGATLIGGSRSSNSPSMRFLRGSLLPSLDRVVAPMGTVKLTPKQMAQLRKGRLEVLVRSNKDTLERGPEGQPVRRGELVAANPTPAALAMAVRAGFRIKSDERSPEFGLRMITLAIPRGMKVQEGLLTLRRIVPQLDVDYNHVFEPAGGALLPAASTALAALAPARPGTRIAMIDGGVAAHPSLARAAVEQRGFAGPARPTGHGTAVGSLLVGDYGSFRGAARGAELYVGDVYGGNPAAGSATTIVKALAWAASKRPRVINVSLVGPDNRLLSRAIVGLLVRGIPVVAAVGNDGPAAPPAYPASYPGVVAVTGVDAGDRALREAGQAKHLDFAAPGADLIAALPGKGYTAVRGTSFASPFVAARLASTGSSFALAAEAVPGKGKVGRGIVCKPCRITPKMVGLRVR